MCVHSLSVDGGTLEMFDLTRRSLGWIWGYRLSAIDLHWVYCSCLRLSDVDGGEAAGLSYALLLVFLRGNADLAGLARASE